MARPKTSEVVDALSKRREYLTALHDGPLTKRGVVDALDAPRSTVDRAIRELEAVGLADRDAGSYRLTTFGRLARAAHEEYLRTIDDLSDAAAVTASLSETDVLDRAMVEGATVHAAEPHAPEAPVHQFLDRIRRADHVRGLSPVVLSACIDAFHDAVVNHGVCVELVVSSDVRDSLTTTYARRFDEAVATGSLDVFEAETSLPFGLWLVESGDAREAAVVVYDDGGVGLIRNDREAAYDWAADRYRSHRQSAHRVAGT